MEKNVHKKITLQGKIDLCGMIDAQLEVVKRFHRERTKYVEEDKAFS